MRIVVTKTGKVEISSFSTPKNHLILPPLSTNEKRKDNLPFSQTPTYQPITKIERFPQFIKQIKIQPKKLNIPSSMEILYSKENSKNYIINDISSTLSESNLPTYQKEFPLKSILSPINIKEEENKKKERKKDRINYHKEINVENANLINYLSENKKITNSFLTKISHLNDEQLYKLNKICQKHIHNEEVRSVMKNVIKKKVQWEYVKDSDYYKKGLMRMKNDLLNYKSVYKKLQKKEDDYFSHRQNYCLHKHY